MADELDSLLADAPAAKAAAAPPAGDDLDKLLAGAPSAKAAPREPQKPLPGTEAFGGKLPGMPAPPIPQALQSDAQVMAEINAAIQNYPDTARGGSMKPIVKNLGGDAYPGQPTGADIANLGIATGVEGVVGLAASRYAPVAQAGKLANAAISSYFATESGLAALKAVPEAWDLHQKGDDWGAIGKLGQAGLEGAMATLAGLHAHGEFGAAENIGAAGRIIQENLNAQEAARAAAERADAARQQANAPRLPQPVAQPAAPNAASPATPTPPGPAPAAAPNAPPEPVAPTAATAGQEAAPPTQEIAKGSKFETPEGTFEVKLVSGNQVIAVQTTPRGPVSRLIPLEKFQQLVGSQPSVVSPQSSVVSQQPAPVQQPTVQPSGQPTVQPSGQPAAQPKDELDTLLADAPKAAGFASIAPNPANVQPSAATSEPHEFSSTQVNLPGPIAKQVRAAGFAIPESQLADDGRETEPHITVKYGLHGNDSADVQKLLQDEPPVTATLGNASIFKTKNSGDVLKVDVESPDLHRLNAKISDALPHTDSHPVYQPHVTIAYLKPGEGEQYDGKPVPGVTGQTVELGSVKFSPKEGEPTDIPLTGKSSDVGPSPAVQSEGVSAKGGSGEQLPPNQKPQAPEGGEPAIFPNPAQGGYLDEDNVVGLMQAIREGKNLPPIVAREGGQIIGGHHRAEAYQRLGLKPKVVYVPEKEYQGLRSEGEPLDEIEYRYEQGWRDQIKEISNPKPSGSQAGEPTTVARAPGHSPLEKEVLRFIGKQKDAYSLTDNFGYSEHNFDDLNKALLGLIRKGDVERVQMGDRSDGFKRVIKAKPVSAGLAVEAPATPVPASGAPSGAVAQAPTESPANVREDALQQVKQDPEAILTAYKQRFGNVLNADNAAELFPAYSASLESRTRFRAAVHPAAQWIRDELFQQSLADSNVHQVAFTAGGNGAGKTTGALSADVVMDTTLSNPEHSERLVQSALDAGKQVAIVYTYRPISEALSGVLDRSKTQGRTVSITALIKAHEGAAKTVAALHDKYARDPNVKFTFIDNSEGKSVPSTLAVTDKEDYGEKRGELERLLESRRSELPSHVYDATKGSRPGGVGKQDNSAGLRQSEPGQGRTGSAESEVTASPAVRPQTQTVSETPQSAALNPTEQADLTQTLSQITAIKKALSTGKPKPHLEKNLAQLEAKRDRLQSKQVEPKKPVTPQIVPEKKQTLGTKPNSSEEINSSDKPTIEPEPSRGAATEPTETRPAGPENSQALEGQPASDVSGPGEAGQVTPGGSERGGDVRGHPGGRNSEGTAVSVSGGSGAADSLPAGRGGRSAPPVESSVSHDYRITPADQLGSGGEKTKANNNLEAIRILKTVEKEGREATPAEQAALVKYVGWGQLSQIFDTYRREWSGLREELENLLTPEEFASARKSTTNAHYTTPEVIGGIYQALSHLGLAPDSRMLDPGSGISHFRGMIPDNLLPVKYTGVEMDPISGGIARLLYPSANIQISPFEKTSLPNNYFDVAAGNVPFGNFGVHDAKYKQPLATRSIHNYFFVKSLDKLRPGGILAFVTSAFTMDEASPAMRNLLASKANLLGAIRLPGGKGGAFAKNAGTEVTTDIIFLQKRAPQTEASGERWEGLAPVQGTGEGGKSAAIPVNEYYHRHPEMMLGRMALEGTMYGPEKSKVLLGDLTPEALAAAVAKLPNGAYSPAIQESQAFQPNPIHELPTAGEIKDGGFGLKGDTVIIREGDSYRPAELTAEQGQRVKGMLKIRDAVREVFRTQMSGASEAEVQRARKLLGSAYDRYVASQIKTAKGLAPAGPLNSTANIKAMAGDPDAPLLSSLENYNRETGQAAKREIFSKRTIEKYTPIDHVEKASEALAVSLAELGRIDWARMQDLTGKTPDELRAELGGLVFRNPEGHAWETQDDYLSGNVRAKLQAAEIAARTDRAFERNADALRAVQPKDLTPGQINARLGASWMPTTDVRDFIGELLGVSKYNFDQIQVSHAGVVGHWGVQLGDQVKSLASNTDKWGSPEYTAGKLIEGALNLQSPTVYRDEWVGPGPNDVKRVVDKKGTLAALDKQEKIRDEWKKWLWSDGDRANRLSRQYNDEFNNLRLREYDGSFLTFLGMARWFLRNGDLDPHQKNAIWRIIQGGNALLAHVVGAGKTFEMIAAGMEMKRIGLIKKPMYVVPNHLVEQWGADFLRLYPSANIFVAGKEHFSTGNRQKAMSRIATGNYDAVIVAHRSFQFLPVSDATFEKFIHEQMTDIDNALHEAQLTDTGSGGRRGKGGKSRSVKELEKARARLEKQLEDRAKREASDKTIDFEQMGVDQIFVDEADMFKNLYYVSKMTRVAGLPNSQSNRAMDMFIKSQYLTRLNNGKRGVVFATGTPIANSMAEMYTMQRYLSMDRMKEQGVQAFDSWVQNFAMPQTGMELAPEGTGYRMNTRFSKFINVAELLTAFRSFADVKNAEDLNLPRPKLKGGKPTIVSVPASPELKAFVQSLGKRAEAIRGGKVKPKEDNMLKVVGDGRKAALDMRLVAPGLPDNPNSKIQVAVSKVAQTWKDTAANKSTQLMFLDLGTPRATDIKEKDGEPAVIAQPEDAQAESTYRDIKNKLIAKGVPAKEIAFIHDAKDDAAKQVLFDNVNSGRIRILIGSTEKMGAGMNVQRKLIALHHLDVPWRPRDIEQRDGRGLRQGNENPEIEINRYVTEDSFDAFMWQMILAKATTVKQAMSGDLSVREIEDVGVMQISAAEAMAASSGNPEVRERIGLGMDVQRLEALAEAHADAQRSARMEVASLPKKINALQRDLADSQVIVAKREAFPEGQEPWTVKGKGPTPKDATERNQKLIGLALSMAGDEGNLEIGSYKGFPIVAVGKGVWAHKENGKEVSTPQPPLIEVGGLSTFYQPQSEHDALSMAANIRAQVDNTPDRDIRVLSERIATAQGRLRDLQAETNAPFDQQARLEAMKARLQELNQKLDIDKPDAQAVDLEDEAGQSEPAAPGIAKRLLTEESGEVNVSKLGRAGAAQISAASHKAGAMLSAASDDILKLLAPAARQGAESTALTVRNRAAEYARSQAIAEKALDATRKALAKLPPSERWAFYDRAENGETEPDPKLAQIASAFRKLLDAGRREVQQLGTGKLQNFIENYLPHIYKDPEKAEQAFASYYAKRPMEGKKSFLKRRKYETLKEAMDEGLAPISDNPADMVVLKLAEMNRYVMAHRILHDMKAEGTAVFVRAGRKAPQGYQQINDKIATVFGPPTIEVEHPAMMQSQVGQTGGMMGADQPGAQYPGTKTEDVHVPGIRIMGQYYAPEPAARIINNFLSPGLRSSSPLFRGYLTAANAMNQFQLGFSAFHLGFTTVDASVSKFALGLYQAAHGHPIQGFVSALKTPLAPFTGVMQGDKMLKEYYKPGSQGDQVGTLVNAMIVAGGRAKMDSFYQTQITQKMVDAFRAAFEPGRSAVSRFGNVASGVARSPLAVAEQSVKPILEWIVPRQKMAIFADMAQFELQRMAQGALSPEELEGALARAWDSVDNRMGQLVYDNLFWDKTFKDLLMASVRSVGWNTGTIREIVGGAADVRKMGLGGGGPDMSTRLAYTLALPIVVGLLGSVLYYLWHGKGPDNVKDRFLVPDPHGSRWWLPSYVKDIESVHQEGVLKVAKGKIHPFLTTLMEMLTNEDYFDRPIRNTDDPIVKQLDQEANFLLQQMTPMSLKGPAGKRQPARTTMDKTLPQIGITRVPAGVLRTEKQKQFYHPAHERSPY